jgi:hypothetical protein
MNKKQITKIVVSLAIVVVIIVVFFAIRSGETPKSTYTIESDDGKAKLEISQGAIPEGVDISDISVTRVQESELLFEKTEGEEIIVYILEPDGLRFEEDILFKATFDNTANTIPMLYQVINGNAIETIDDIYIEMDLATKKTTVSAPISHFSEMHISGAGGFLPEISAKALFSAEAEVSDTFVGETATGKAIITIISNAIDVHDYTGWATLGGGGWRIVLNPDSLRISGKLLGYQNLSPLSEISNRPPATAFSYKTYSVPTSDYVCEDVGPARITFEVELTWTETRKIYGRFLFYTHNMEEETGTKRVVISVITPFECVTPPPPKVISTYPTNGAEDITTNLDIEIKFKVPMDQKSTEAAISIDSPNSTIKPLYHWSDGNLKLTNLIYRGELEKDTVYEVYISTEAKSELGVHMKEPYEFSFTTTEEEETENEVVLVEVNAVNVVTDTGVDLVEGDKFEISVDPDQIWIAGTDEPYSRKSNADGISSILYGQLTQGNLTANYGALVGQIGTGEYFLVGTAFAGKAPESGRLSLYYWDDWFPDNSGEVEVVITYPLHPETK